MKRIEGLDEAFAALAKLGEVGERNARKAVAATAQRVRTNAIKSIQERRSTGVTYQKFTPMRVHTASAPGNPPNTDTGELVRSIRVAMLEGPSAAVGTALDKGLWLELGTRNMAPRPWLNPAADDAADYFVEQMKKALLESIQAVAQ